MIRIQYPLTAWRTPVNCFPRMYLFHQMTFSGSCFIENGSLHIVAGFYQYKKVRSLPNWVRREPCWGNVRLSISLSLSLDSHQWMFLKEISLCLNTEEQLTGRCCTARRPDWTRSGRNDTESTCLQTGSVQAVYCVSWQSEGFKKHWRPQSRSAARLQPLKHTRISFLCCFLRLTSSKRSSEMLRISSQLFNHSF